MREDGMINRKMMYSAAFYFVFIMIVGALSIGLILANKQASAQNQGAAALAPNFVFNNHTYPFTYVASNLSAWESGLMNKTVSNSTFELFDFHTTGIYPFWMKDTYYPLDIIWVNGSNVTYVASAIPCSTYSSAQTNCTIYNNYSQGHLADYVIEAASGFANRTDLKAGDRIAITT